MPIVSERPTEMTYSTIAYANPWKTMLTMMLRKLVILRPFRSLSSLRIQNLPLIPDVANGLHGYIDQFASDLLDLVDVDVHHDVARIGIDGDRSARADRVGPGLYRLHRALAGDNSLLRLDRGKYRRHSIP